MNFDVNNLRIASPCPKSWNEMTGGDRTRHCDVCELNVHNVAGMTRDEVARLVGESNGRLCMRLVRRADGTVMTKDCPVGLRAIRKRAAGIATAAFASVLSLFATSYAQDKHATRVDASKVQTTRSADLIGKAELRGTIRDPNGAVVPGFEVQLFKNSKNPVAVTTSDDKGRYVFKDISAGNYEIRVPKNGGFATSIVQNIAVASDAIAEVSVVVAVAGDGELIGVVADSSMIDMTTNERKTVFTREMLDRMPGGRPF